MLNFDGDPPPTLSLETPRFSLETRRFSLETPNLGVSNENIGVSHEIMGSPIKICGSPVATSSQTFPKYGLSIRQYYRTYLRSQFYLLSIKISML